MKLLKTCASVAMFLICCTSLSAQEKFPLNEPDPNKPRLFADLPQKMDLKATDLKSLLTLKVGAVVSLNITSEFLLEGTVVSRSQDPQVSSVVIRCSNRPGAIFTYSRIITREHGEKITGRMISRHSGDAYEIVYEKGGYVLLKKDYYDMINE